MKIRALCIDGIRRMAEVNQENTGRVTFKNVKTKGRVLHAKFHGIKRRCSFERTLATPTLLP